MSGFGYAHQDRVVYGQLIIACINTSIDELVSQADPQLVIPQVIQDELGNFYTSHLLTRDGMEAFSGQNNVVILRCVAEEIITEIPQWLDHDKVGQVLLRNAQFSRATEPLPGLYVSNDEQTVAVPSNEIWFGNQDGVRYQHRETWNIYNFSMNINDVLEMYWEMEEGKLPSVSEGEHFERRTYMISGIGGKTRVTVSSTS